MPTRWIVFVMQAQCCLVTLLLVIGGRACAQENERPPEYPFPKVIREFKELKIPASETPLNKLRIARFNAAVREFKAWEAMHRGGQASIEGPLDAGKRAIIARLDFTSDLGERVQWYETLVLLAKSREYNVKLQQSIGASTAGTAAAAQAEYLRIEAEIQALQARQEAKK